jgi:calcineurin-like phosphoesterase family protein
MAVLRRVAIVAFLQALSSSAFASTEVRLAKGPYVTGVSETGADVRFELDQAVPAALTIARDGAPPATPQRFESRDPSALHVVRVTGLEGDTRYTYSVRANGAVVGDGQFSTSPAAGTDDPVAFVVYGDDRTDPTAHAAIVRGMLQVPAAFLVNTGDMVEDGGDPDAWQTFFSIEAPLLRDRPIFVAIGNHELVNDLAGANFARYFGFPSADGLPKLYGTVRFGSVRLFFLNAMHSWDSGEERDWLVGALTSSDAEPGVRWRIAVAHHGPWSSGPHGPSANLNDAGIPGLLRAHHVDLVLSGHDHIYERGSSGGLKYLVSGGGGAPLYRIDRLEPTSLKAESTYHFILITATASTMKLVARRVDGTVLDACGFAKGQPWDCDPPASVTLPPLEPGGGGRPRASAASCRCESGGKGGDRSAVTVMAILVVLAGARRLRALG